jgi:hypothetical protein
MNTSEKAATQCSMSISKIRSATSVWTAVVAPADEIGGHYCENCHVGNIVPDDVPITALSEGVRGYALDPAVLEPSHLNSGC